MTCIRYTMGIQNLMFYNVLHTWVANKKYVCVQLMCKRKTRP